MRTTTMTSLTFRATPQRQRGAVLFAALVMLVLMTLLVLTSSRTALLEEKMAGGTRSSQLARMGADSAARNAEVLLWSASARAISSGGGIPLVVCGVEGKFGCYPYRPHDSSNPTTSFLTAKGWDTTNSTRFDYEGVDLKNLGTDDKTANLAQNPAIMVEDYGVELPPGSPPAHESGVTGGGAGNRSVDKHVFRISTRSTGGSTSVIRTAQTIFAAKSN